MPDIAQFDLTKILRPIEPEIFFRDSWEKRPFAVARNDPAHYDGLFARRDLDSVITFTRPKFLEPEHFRSGEPARITFVRGWLSAVEPSTGSYPDLASLHRAYIDGKTMIIDSMHDRWPAIAAMCRNLEAFFGCPVQTNLYLTPPGAQGFAAHFDTHEVFVLQIDGDKHWRFYGIERELPLPNDKMMVRKDKLGTPTQEVTLHPGDMVYMPRGHVHEAFTSERASMHLTVGVKVFRWVDLIRQALTRAAADDVRFRETLPLGLLCAGSVPAALKGKFQQLLKRFAESADPEGAVGAMAANFVRSLTALPHDYFAGENLEQIDLDTVLERAPGVIFTVVEQEDNVTLQAPGGGIDGPAKIAPALRFIARKPRFTPRALPDDLTPNAKLVLVRRLVREKLLTIMNSADDAAREP